MHIEIYTEKDRSVSKWSGGETTQLWIFPKDGDYASRNFRARISSATVRTEESDFTALSGVVRYITPLSGGFTLRHGDGRTIRMEPLSEPYRFDGGIATHCSGKATDFNLMLKGVEGNMAILSGKLTLGSEICCVYPLQGGVTVNGKPLPLRPGDLAVIYPDPTVTPTTTTTVTPPTEASTATPSTTAPTVEITKAIVCTIRL